MIDIIVAKEKTVKQVLGEKYAVDFYQREYKWGEKQVTELVDDLVNVFDAQWEPGYEQEQGKVRDFRGYFLGSIIVSERDNARFIVDGQQRLTTLTLLLMSLRCRVDEVRKGDLGKHICSVSFGREQFNLDVPAREECLRALYEGKPFEKRKQSESIVNLVERYATIDEMMGGLAIEREGQGPLPFPFPAFSDWLLEKACLAEIRATSDEDAYTVFETMNDRGLSLTPTEMLKGYLLAKISDLEIRNKAEDVWKEHVGKLVNYGKEEDSNAIKTWLRGKHAQSIRERKSGADPQDFDRIGSEFHRWVKSQEDTLKLDTDAGLKHFITNEFAFYAGWYLRLRRAADDLASARQDGLECVYYNAESKFTLQFPVLLSSLNPGDSDSIALPKLRAISAYLDILIHRRFWNGRSIAYSTMSYAMFQLMRKLRDKDANEIVEFLQGQLEYSFSANPHFHLRGNNKPKVRRILARMTAHLQEHMGESSQYMDFVKYEVEHIWADQYEKYGHSAEFNNEADFQAFRNRIGGLLLLPESVNRSLQDKPYEDKLGKYLRENPLAKSLHKDCHENNPALVRFKEKSGLPFKPHTEFKKQDLEERQTLYLQFAEWIWRPDRIREAAES